MMNYEIFLNKEDQRSYSLLRHLEESPRYQVLLLHFAKIINVEFLVKNIRKIKSRY